MLGAMFARWSLFSDHGERQHQCRYEICQVLKYSWINTLSGPHVATVRYLPDSQLAAL